MVVEGENKIMSAGELFGVLGEDSQFYFARGDVETPGAEPLKNVVDGGLKVGDGERSFPASPAREGAMEVCVVCKLRAGNVFGDEVGEVKNEDEVEGRAENAALGDTIRHGDRRAANPVLCDSGGAASEVIH